MIWVGVGAILGKGWSGLVSVPIGVNLVWCRSELGTIWVDVGVGVGCCHSELVSLRVGDSLAWGFEYTWLVISWGRRQARLVSVGVRGNLGWFRSGLVLVGGVILGWWRSVLV